MFSWNNCTEYLPGAVALNKKKKLKTKDGPFLIYSQFHSSDSIANSLYLNKYLKIEVTSAQDYFSQPQDAVIDNDTKISTSSYKTILKESIEKVFIIFQETL